MGWDLAPRSSTIPQSAPGEAIAGRIKRGEHFLAIRPVRLSFTRIPACRIMGYGPRIWGENDQFLGRVNLSARLWPHQEHPEGWSKRN